MKKVFLILLMLLVSLALSTQESYFNHFHSNNIVFAHYYETEEMNSIHSFAKWFILDNQSLEEISEPNKYEVLLNILKPSLPHTYFFEVTIYTPDNMEFVINERTQVRLMRVHQVEADHPRHDLITNCNLYNMSFDISTDYQYPYLVDVLFHDDLTCTAEHKPLYDISSDLRLNRDL